MGWQHGCMVSGGPTVGAPKPSCQQRVCRVQHPRINEAADAVRAAVAELRVPPYVESTGAGALRYLQLTAVGSDPERPTAQRDPRALVQARAARSQRIVMRRGTNLAVCFVTGTHLLKTVTVQHGAQLCPFVTDPLLRVA